MAAPPAATPAAQYSAMPPPGGQQQAAWQQPQAHMQGQAGYYDPNYYASYYQHYPPAGAPQHYNPQYYHQYYQQAGAAPQQGWPQQPQQPAPPAGAPPASATPAAPAPPPGNPPASTAAPPAASAAQPAALAAYDYAAAYHQQYHAHYSNFYQQQAPQGGPQGYAPPAGGVPWQAAAPPSHPQQAWGQHPPSYAAVASGKPPAPSAGVLAPICPAPAATPPAAKPAPSIVVRPQMSKTATAAAKIAADLTAQAKQGGAPKAVPAYVKVAQAGIGAQQPAAPAQPKGWPPSLSNYVSRTFMRFQDRKSIEKPLQDIIKQAEVAGELWTRNWDTHPLPLMQPGGAKRPSPSPSPKGGAAQKNKRKWQRQVMEKDSDSSENDDPQAKQKRMQRAQRFGAGHAVGAVPQSKPAKGRTMKQRLKPVSFYSGGAGIVTKAQLTMGADEEIDWAAHTVRGTCQSLEKSYFRLTCAPDPNTVRPEVVLRKALERILRILKDGSENYFYCQDQLKAMRQDCTVQHIRNAFTAELYEAHARAALEYGEMGDYIQCQTKLNDLYSDGIPGSKDEFMAYYTLHLVAHSQLGGDDGALQRTALMNWLRSMTESERSGPAVAHALKVRAATAMDNNVAFFQLKACAPNLGARIMELHEEQMRFNATTVLTRSFKPTLSIAVVARMLGFQLPGLEQHEEDDAAHVVECIEWLKLHGAVLKDLEQGPDAARLDCKESADSLFIPEREDACAHGDANLAVDDFMKRMRTE
eukprot:jgi/Tetstr1/456383/TSEL_043117.t1